MKKLLIALLLAAPVAHATSPCPTMTRYNVFIVYNASASNCVVNSQLPCTLGEAIQFSVAAFGYDFSCSAHTFLWEFGDGATSSVRTPTHAFTGPGMYAVKVTVATGSQQLTLTQNVFVGFIDPPPPFEVHPLADELGRVKRGYIFTIGGATGEGDWIWNFGDGTVVHSPQRVQTHIYKTGGTFRVTLSSASAPGIYTIDVNVPIDRRRSARH